MCVLHLSPLILYFALGADFRSGAIRILLYYINHRTHLSEDPGFGSDTLVVARVDLALVVQDVFLSFGSVLQIHGIGWVTDHHTIPYRPAISQTHGYIANTWLYRKHMAISQTHGLYSKHMSTSQTHIYIANTCLYSKHVAISQTQINNSTEQWLHNGKTTKAVTK